MRQESGPVVLHRSVRYMGEMIRRLMFYPALGTDAHIKIIKMNIT